MRTMRVMDTSRGDKPIQWNEKDPKTWVEAALVFDAVKAAGGQVFRAQPSGEGGGVVSKFDPQADMIATPRIQGG
ncbi:MAG: hypothetical protein A3G27_18840 [Betaproteobacteria bacterium RIFCSPLOWO2_12_FULL_66_14]|nr:MAG: hypothetical protein A3G27_18840 [Betaproteobacteria bacterium RIFCSPLOWO2_12_FULL_66_14]